MVNAQANNGFTQRYSTIIQSVTVVGLFVAGFWAGVISPIQYHLTQLDGDTIKIREHNEFKSRIDSERQIIKDDVRRNLERLEAMVNKLATDQVSRAEHNQHWEWIAERINAVNARMNDIGKEYSSSYTLGDQLKSLQKQLDDLRMDIRNHPPVVVPVKP